MTTPPSRPTLPWNGEGEALRGVPLLCTEGGEEEPRDRDRDDGSFGYFLFLLFVFGYFFDCGYLNVRNQVPALEYQ